MSDNALGSQVFSFGKHKGRSFRDVFTQEYSYVIWALQIKEPTGQMQDFCRYIRSLGTAATGDSPFKNVEGTTSNSSAYPRKNEDAGNTGGVCHDGPSGISSQAANRRPNPPLPCYTMRMGDCLEAKWRRINAQMKGKDYKMDEDDLRYVIKKAVAQQNTYSHPSYDAGTLKRPASMVDTGRNRQADLVSQQPSGQRTATVIAGAPLYTSDKGLTDKPGVYAKGLNGENKSIHDFGVPYAQKQVNQASTANITNITTTNIFRGPIVVPNECKPRDVNISMPTPLTTNNSTSNVFNCHVGPMDFTASGKPTPLLPVRKSPDSIKVDIKGVVALVLHSTTEFHISFQKSASEGNSVWTSTLPSSLFDFLRALEPNMEIKKDGKCSYVVFEASKYDSILKELRKKLTNCSCPVDPIPNFILRCFPAFSKYAKKVNMPEKTLQGLSSQICEYTQKNMCRIGDLVGHELYSQLKPFQLEGLRFGISKNGRLLIGDEMGLGKTLQALAISAFYCVDWPLLIVCPSSLRFQWRDQCVRWLPHLITKDEICTVISGKTDIPDHTKIVIISYELYTSNEHFRHSFRMVICDESHYIKNKDAKRTKSLVPLIKGAKRAILLSGTPTLNTPSELYEQLSGLLPDFCSRSVFVERYCEKKLHWYTKKMIYSGSKHAGELHIFLVKTVMIRRLKDNVLHELPPKIRSKVPIELPKTFLREYKQAMAAFSGEESIEGGKANLTKIQEMLKLTGEAKSKAVCEYIVHLINSEIKFIIFAHHIVVLDNIEAALKHHKCNYIRIDGSTSQNKREEYVNRFQNDEKCTIALLSLTACGVGLNLTASSTVIFAELHWVPGQMIQAEDRAHRMGTKHRVINIHYLIAEQSLEEMIWKVINRKWKDVTATLDGEISNIVLMKDEEKEKINELSMQPKIVDFFHNSETQAKE